MSCGGCTLRDGIAFSEDGIVIHTLRGRPTVEALEEALDRQIGDPRWRPGTPVLVDLRDMDLSALEYEDVVRIAAVTRARGPRLGDGRVAIVVGRPVDFGRGRQFSALTAMDGGRERRVFSDMDAARAWVRGG